MTCHLVYPEDHPGDDFIDRVSAGISEKFRIGHATLQIEKAPSAEHLSRAC
jgi:cobalt-zinc-cadmium efflux system protein